VRVAGATKSEDVARVAGGSDRDGSARIGRGECWGAVQDSICFLDDADRACGERNVGQDEQDVFRIYKIESCPS